MSPISIKICSIIPVLKLCGVTAIEIVKICIQVNTQMSQRYCNSVTFSLFILLDNVVKIYRPNTFYHSFCIFFFAVRQEVKR